MGSLLSLYFLHPITTWLANKTQRFNPRYELTNPTKNPTPSFCFLPSLCYSPSSTLHTPIPFYFIYHPFLPLLLSPVPLLLCLLIPCYSPSFLCYPVSSPSVTTLCSHVTLSPLTLSPLFSSSVTTPRSFVTLSPFTLSPYILSCKECLPVLSTGAFTLSKTRPFKHAEHALLAPWRRLSCPLTMPFLETRVQVFDSKEVTIVKETDMMSLSKWFG